MTFYEQFKLLCKEAGISPSRAATEMGISKSSVSVWKNTGSSPNFDTLKKISEYFGKDITFVSTPEKRSYEEIAKVALFGGSADVSDEMWREIKRYAEFIKEKRG